MLVARPRIAAEILGEEKLEGAVGGRGLIELKGVFGPGGVDIPVERLVVDDAALGNHRHVVRSGVGGAHVGVHLAVVVEHGPPLRDVAAPARLPVRAGAGEEFPPRPVHHVVLMDPGQIQIDRVDDLVGERIPPVVVHTVGIDIVVRAVFAVLAVIEEHHGGKNVVAEHGLVRPGPGAPLVGGLVDRRRGCLVEDTELGLAQILHREIEHAVHADHAGGLAVVAVGIAPHLRHVVARREIDAAQAVVPRGSAHPSRDDVLPGHRGVEPFAVAVGHIEEIVVRPGGGPEIAVAQGDGYGVLVLNMRGGKKGAPRVARHDLRQRFFHHARLPVF